MKKMSIMSRLWFLTMFLMGIIVVLGGYTFWRSADLFKSLEYTATQQLPAIRYMTLTDMYHDNLRAVVIESLYDGRLNKLNRLKEITKEKDEAIEQFQTNVSKLSKLNLSVQTQKLIEDSRSAMKDYLGLSSEVVNLAASGDLEKAEMQLPAFEKSFSALEEKLDVLGSNVEKEATNISSEGSNTLFMIGALSFMGVALGLVFSIWTVRNIRFYTQEFLANVMGAGETMITISDRLARANEQFSSSATEGAASLEETVASLDELSSMVTLNTENAQRASEVSIKSRESAMKGEEEIQDLSKAMGEIKHSSQKMEEIINVIDEIAFQTNLLALNAAVEAARAGEQGRGFAVVAEAVRSLAQRSAVAAKDISQMIKESISKIDVGVGIVDSSREDLRQIFTSIKEVSDLNQQISAASVEQTSGIRQISQAMNQLDTVSQQTAGGALEVSTISENMLDESIRLKEFVRQVGEKFLGTHDISHKNEDSKSQQSMTEKSNRSSGGVVINLDTAAHEKPHFDSSTRKISNLNDF